MWELYPDWLDQRCEKGIGCFTMEQISSALNKPAAMVLRANLLKTTPAQLQTNLTEVGIETELLSWAPDALQLKFSRNVFRYEAFKNG